MPEVGRQRKNQPWKGSVKCCGIGIPFSKYSNWQKDVGMDKRRAIQIIAKSARLYHSNLEDQKILFLYGIPSEVRRQLQIEGARLSAIKSYEVVFHRYNFLHLIGVSVHSSGVGSAIHFYEKSLANRLIEEDFYFAKDGSTIQKLDVLENMMRIKRNAMMIGDFTDRGPKLFTEKAAGNVCGCVGFVKDRNTGLNVPNTLLKKDIRDVVANPAQKIFAVFSKMYTDEKYSVAEKIDRSLMGRKILFSEEIEKLLKNKDCDIRLY